MIRAVAGAAIPVFVMRDYYQSVLTLRWRAWMTERYVEKYLGDRNFYHIQTGGVIDNPDQRIVDDISSFTATTVGLAFTLLNAGVDLVSFSGILLGIYEPLVAVLFVYAAGGTLISAKLGQPLVGLSFQQEAREADFRYGLVRVRENAESVAFYGGEAAERGALVARLRAAVDNFGDLLVATRNVDFFTSCYRYLVTFLPAAVVAPLYFKRRDRVRRHQPELQRLLAHSRGRVPRGVSDRTPRVVQRGDGSSRTDDRAPSGARVHHGGASRRGGTSTNHQSAGGVALGRHHRERDARGGGGGERGRGVRDGRSRGRSQARASRSHRSNPGSRGFRSPAAREGIELGGETGRVRAGHGTVRRGKDVVASRGGGVVGTGRR